MPQVLYELQLLHLLLDPGNYRRRDVPSLGFVSYPCLVWLVIVFLDRGDG